MNQSRLISICGLNAAKHRRILDDMAQKGFLNKKEEAWGSKTIFKYSISEKGADILRQVLAPYEELFPRERTETSADRRMS